MQSTCSPERGQAHAQEATSVPYLETCQKSCGEGETAEITTYELIGCSCKSRFCPQCCVPMGWKLRHELTEVLESFTGLQMWTLTIDPQLFESPEAAYRYCREKRVIGEMVRFLDEKGVLHSKRYFVAVEWQQGTEMVHYHLLLDASYVPWELMRDRWNRFRPKEAGPLPVDSVRPAFGSIRYSAPKFADSKHAANYATKYVIKTPEYGFPDWVLDYEGKIHRYHVSKGFFPRPSKPKDERGEAWEADVTEEDDDEWHGAGCFCEHCREAEEPERPKKLAKTVRERIARCRDKAVVIEKKTKIFVGGTFEEERHYLGDALLPYDKACDLLGRYDNGRGRVDITFADARLVLTGESPPEWEPREQLVTHTQATFW